MRTELLQMAADLARREEPFGALPFVDRLLPAHTLESLERLVPLLAA